MMAVRLLYFVFTMFSTLKLCSYNSHGLGPGRIEYIDKLVECHDFILIQEHWLHNEQLHQFERDLEVNVHGISGMDSSVLHKGRPFGGCAILWKRSFLGKVSPIETCSTRICAVKVNTENTDILIFSVYMPCDTTCNNSEYDSILSEISTICQMHNIEFVIIGGDFNTDFSRINSCNTQSLVNFMDNENLICGLTNNKSKVIYTFESKASGDKSTIDHFVFSESLFGKLDYYESLHHGDNLSDHSVISVKLDIPINHMINCNSDNRCKIQWCKATCDDIEQYQRELNNLLHSIQVPHCALECSNFVCNKHKDELDIFYNDIINACLTAGENCIPHSGKGSTHKVVPGWNEYVNHYRETSLFWHHIWKCNNCPKTGIIADIRRKTRCKYHYALRFVKANKDRISSEKMASALSNNSSRAFWSEVNKVKQVKKLIPNIVDDCTGKTDIGNLFKEKYKNLYNCVSYCSKDMNQLKNDVNINIKNSCNVGKCKYSHQISIDDIVKGISHIKPGKTDGDVGHCSDHILNGTHLLHNYLSILFNSMLCHGHSPDGIVLSTITSIPKCKRKSINDSENYRGIALSSILGKIFDWIILVKYSDIFETTDLQFGFKPKHSTSQCTFVVKEVINYYLKNGGQVYVTLLDASKAFDRINYVKLFKLLLRKGLCPLVSRFLLNMYTNQLVRVRWGDYTTTTFSVSNGVKQGGVLSPILFSIYVDELLTRLKQSGVGCHIGHIFVGSLAYADDISLLSPTRQGLYKMLNICKSFSTEYDVLFNPNKSKLLLFDNESCTSENVPFCDAEITAEKYETHLGNIIGPRINNEDIKKLVNDFYSRFNILYSMFNHVPINVKYFLFKTYCMPLYGSQLWDFSSNNVNSFYVAWRKCIRRLLQISNLTHNNLLNVLCDDLPVDTQLHKRFLRFAHGIFCSSNSCVNICGRVSINGSGSDFCKSLNFISYKYKICKYDLSNSISSISSSVENYVNVHSDWNVLQSANNIFDFICMREELIRNRKFEDAKNVNLIINHLCTN